MTKSTAEITGLHIALDGRCTLQRLPKRNALARLYELTASDCVEAPPVHIGTSLCHMYIDEEGKFRQAPNIVATGIWQRCWGRGDHICGPAFIVGPPDQHGYETSIPAAALRKLKADGLEISEDES